MNYPDRVQMIEKVDTGERDDLGRPVLVDTVVAEAPAFVVLVSADEHEQLGWPISSLSVRVPPKVHRLAADGVIRVLSGPHAGLRASVTSTRHNRDHARYIVEGTTAPSS